MPIMMPFCIILTHSFNQTDEDDMLDLDTFLFLSQLDPGCSPASSFSENADWFRKILTSSK